MRMRATGIGVAGLAVAVTALTMPAGAGPDFRPFDEVAKGFTKVVSTPDGKASFYTIFVDRKDNQMLAELPRGYEGKKHLVAVTQASGGIFAGLMGPQQYVYWKRYGKRVALFSPEIDTKSTGEAESQSSVERLFTDRVLIDVPIVCMGPGGQPVIDMDDLLVNRGMSLMGGGRANRFGGGGGGVNARLQKIAKAKAFPENVELAFEVPVGGKLQTMHYSFSQVPKSTGYKPRKADTRIGYFTTHYRDLGKYNPDEKWTRYIDRWHLQKRDPKLKLSPPKEPIVFYLEHTVPVRYRRWVRRGVEYWNEAFQEIGLLDAIEVRIQDKATGAHMEKDPEDVRYNFIRWLNNDISTAIGPHRAHPETGQILDADIVLTDGWIRAYWRWHQQMPELATESMTPETLRWLEDYPEWDPRILLAPPQDRDRILAEREARGPAALCDHPHDPAVSLHPELAEMSQWVGHDHDLCLAAHGLAFDVAMARMQFEAFGIDQFAGEIPPDQTDTLDGLPEWFVGPLLAELTCHEVGHTLGLRHNFKASSIYTLEEINSEAVKGKKPMAGSVMDYLPANFNFESGPVQGDFTMIGVGPYDKWAIEYGYTFDDPNEVLKKVADPQLAYLTDDDTSGPDPLARRYDFSKEPLDYAENQIRLIEHHRGRILDKFVKEGDSWSKSRDAYGSLLSLQTRSLSMMANWIGGAHVNRDHKGDPDGRPPIEVTDPERQRRALRFCIDNAFSDASFGLTPELMVHMTVDKWSDPGGSGGDSTWPVHDQIIGIQASTLTMIMNPTTLSRVYDNELRTPATEDALTLPELMAALNESIYAELSTDLDGHTFTDRQPMISSLRRNLQSAMINRLVVLANGTGRMPRPIRTLSLHHLRQLQDRVDTLLEKKGTGQIDAYTVAHLEDLKERIGKALDTVYVEQL